MKVVFTKEAAAALYIVSDFVESKNTPGSGKRYAIKFRRAIQKLAQPNVQYTLCNHSLLNALKYSCSHFNDWVIAFRIENNVLVVHQILHSAVLH